MQKISLIAPDDWHNHLRDDIYLHRTVTDTARSFKRAIIMPNLKSPITTVAAAQAYRQRIINALPQQSDFMPLLTLYLTPTLTPADIITAKKSAIIFGCKLYPQGVTTQSEFGVRTVTDIYPTLEAMQTLQLPLLIHGEVPNPDVDIFDRESVFIDTVLTKLLRDFPQLKMVLEHISTKTAVDFVLSAPDTLAATITPHHLLLNRNSVLAGGIKPHHYCLPIVKREADRHALIQAAISGNPKFFLGTDSAPHTQHSKESSCGCAGIYSAYHALPLYLEVFEQAHALNQFEGFASRFGPQFYGLPLNTQTITLCKKPWQVPDTLPFGDKAVIPLLAGQTLHWQLTHE